MRRERTAFRDHSPIPFSLDYEDTEDWLSSAPGLPFADSSRPLQFSSPATAPVPAHEPLLQLLPDYMEAISSYDVGSTSSSSVAPRQHISFSGVKGTPYLDFKQLFGAQQAQKRTLEQSRGIDIHSGADMMAVEMACPPHSAAQQMVASIREGLGGYIAAADLGWFPDSTVPMNLLSILLAEQAGAASAQQYFVTRMASAYGEIRAEAYRQSWVLQPTRIATVLASNHTPEDVLAASAAATAAAAAPEATPAPSGTTARAAATPAGATPATAGPPAAAGSSTSAASGTDAITQLAAALSKLNKPGREKLKHKVTVKGVVHTPHSAVMVVFWVCMDVCFALSGQEDLHEFWKLMKPGSQGRMQLTQFAQHITLRQEIVQHLSVLPLDADISVFVAGLNSAANKEFATRYLENQRAQGATVTIMGLAKAVQQHEQRRLQIQSAERQAQVYAGINPSSSSYTPGGSGGQHGQGRPSQKSAAAEMVRLRLQDPKTQQELEAMAPAKRSLYRAAFALAESEPKHSSAICTDCRLTARMHLNSECRTKQQKAKTPPAAAVGMAAKLEVSPAAGAKEDERLIALSAQLQQQQQQMQQMQQLTQSTMTALAALGGSGQLRPGQFTGGPSAPRGAPQQPMPCRLCGFELGHRGSCYCDDPSQAPHFWKGPSRYTPEEGVLRYLQRCVSQGITPKLERCINTAVKLKQEGKVPEQCKPYIDSVWQQQQRRPGVYHAAAVQYWSPQMAYAGHMGLPAAGMQPFPALPPPVPLALPAPAAAAPANPAVIAAVVQQGEQPTELMPLSSGNPFGNSFAMLAVQHSAQEETEPVAAVITRAGKQAAEPTKDAGGRQVMPKSFLPPGPIPADPNSNRDSQPVPSAATEEPLSPEDSGEQAPDSKDLPTGHFEQMADTLSKLKQELLKGEAANRSYITTLEKQIMTGLRAWQSHQQTQGEGMKQFGTAASAQGDFGLLTQTSRSSSSSTSSSCKRSREEQGPDTADTRTPTSPRASRRYVRYVRFAFNPQHGSLSLKDLSRVTLDRVLAVTKEDGITITLPDGRECLLEDVIVDSGSNTLLVTEELCQQLGLHIDRSVDLPGLKGIDGKKAPYLVGRTPPFTLTLGKGSEFPAVLHVPAGALVMKGNAGGMYSMCLDKRTLLPVYGHVNPALQRLLWYPKAAEGDFSIVNGVPVTSLLAAEPVGALAGVSITPEAETVAMAAVQEVDADFAASAAEPSTAAAEAEATTEPRTSSSAGATAEPQPSTGEAHTTDPQVDKKSPNSKKNNKQKSRQHGKCGSRPQCPDKQKSDQHSRCSNGPQSPDEKQNNNISDSSPVTAEEEEEDESRGLLATVARGVLPACSAALLWAVLLLFGLFHVFVNCPMLGWPRALFGLLLDWANWRAPQQPDQRPRDVWRVPKMMLTMFQRAARDHGYRTRKRRPYGLWHSRHWAQLIQSQRTHRSYSAYSLTAKLLLMLLLCIIFSCTSVGAMQVTGSSSDPSPILDSVVPYTRSWWQEQQQMADRCAQQLLQHELTQLPADQYGAAADSSPPPSPSPAPKWYTTDPSALDQLSPDGVTEDAFDSAWTVHPTGKWILGNHPDSTPEQRHKLVELLERQKGAFAYSLDEIPGYAKSLVSFKLIDPNKKMWSPSRRYTEEEYAFGDEKMKEMLDAGVVKEIPSTNPHAAQITLPMKRAPDGSWTDKRYCCDLRKCNSNTVVDKYGMPLPEELFRRVRGSKFLVKADFRSGFWQLKLDEASQSHVAFWWRNKLYTYTRLPFGHVNATAVFQRVMETELQEAGLSHCSAPFVDDVILWADTFEEMLERLETLLQHLQTVGLRLHPAKTILGAQCLPYLGHLVSAEACRPEPAKIAGIKALTPPTCLKQLQAQLGLFNYYRCYVKNFNALAQPLYKLLQKGAEYVWSKEAQQSYSSLKAALCTEGLALRQPVDSLPFHLYVDWSNTGIAAVLNQKAEDGTEYMVACASRSLNSAEKNYPAWKGEMLAAVWGVKLFRPYLHSREFFLHTDHRALLWLLTHKAPVGQQMRWVLALQEYRFTLVHKQGSKNPADVPSRTPSSCLADTTGARLDTHVQDWPLPTVLQSDGRPDPTVYTHDQLAHDLAINSPAVTKQQSPAVSLAATLAATSPAGVLANMPQTNLSSAQLQYETLCCCMASNETELDGFLPPSASMLGGGSPWHF